MFENKPLKEVKEIIKNILLNLDEFNFYTNQSIIKNYNINIKGVDNKFSNMVSLDKVNNCIFLCFNLEEYPPIILTFYPDYVSFYHMHKTEKTYYLENSNVYEFLLLKGT